jgi:protein gp37
MPTRIEWCDETINPLGHWCFGPGGSKEQPKICAYCYAAKYAKRHLVGCSKCQSFSEPHTHFEQLEKLQKWKNPKNIFIQSMGDLFHSEVPDEWIVEVFKACAAAPQHRYLFLTKNPSRIYFDDEDGNDKIWKDAFIDCEDIDLWFGATVTNDDDCWNAYENLNCNWVSIEPIHGEIPAEFFDHDNRYTQNCERRWNWIVIGAETGNRKNKIIPKREWVENIVEECRAWNIPVFMKNSLAEIWGEQPLIQEYPWKE